MLSKKKNNIVSFEVLYGLDLIHDILMNMILHYVRLYITVIVISFNKIRKGFKINNFICKKYVWKSLFLELDPFIFIRDSR